jgi:tight adherence protein B
MAEITSRDLWYALILSCVFAGLLIFLWGGFSLFIEPIRQRRKISRRLAESSEEYIRRIQIIKARLEDNPTTFMAVVRLIVGRERIAALQRHLLQADIYRDTGSFIGIVLLLAAGGFFAGLILLRSSLLGLLLAGLMAVIPVLYVIRKKKQKTLLVERQMPDAMELLARSLRAGHTLPSATELLAEEIEHPLGTEMRIAYEEQRFGLAMHEALTNILDRVNSQDLRYYVTAVVIQNETGGNLVEILERIAQVVRSRLNLKSKIRALTAEGRMSAVGLTILPIIAFFLLITFRHKYEIVLLTDKLGQKILFIGVFLLTFGAIFMKKVIDRVEV